MSKGSQNKYSKIDIIKYKYDNFISKGIRGIIIMLLVITIIFVLLMSLPIILNAKYAGAEKINEVWDNFATVINAWWPFAEEQTVVENIGYFVIKVAIAIFGLFLTSVLIGLISESIDTKIRGLRQGKTKVFEEDHIIVIGYDENNYTLIKELVEVTKKRRTLLIVDDKDKEEMETDFYTNIKCPKNLKVIFRSIKPWNINDLEKCSVEKSSSVIISPIDDISTLKTVMAVKAILHKFPKSKTHISSAIYNDDYALKFSNDRDVMFSVKNLIAKIIATSNQQIGLSKIITSIVSFENHEFYIGNNKSFIGKTFGELTAKMVNAVPIGIYRKGEFIIIPNQNERIVSGDEMVYYAENRDDNIDLQEGKINSKSNNDKIIESREKRSAKKEKEKNEKILIFGYNSKLKTIFKEFSDDIKHVTIACNNKDEKKEINECLKTNKRIKFKITRKENERKYFEKIVSNIDHIIILNDENIDKENSDINNMILYLKLLKIREDNKFSYTMITELYSNENRVLIDSKYENDFIVSSNITSMMLAQMSEDYRLRPIFTELLSTKGINIMLKNVRDLLKYNDIISNIRLKLLEHGLIFLGYVTHENGSTKYIYNPKNNEYIKFKKDDKLIVIGK